MKFIIHQKIIIQNIKIGSIANSSILQIGSTGSIRALSNLYNTGRFVEPAPLPGAPVPPLVPLSLPTN